MKQEEWTQRLRDHLADYEAPVTDDLWEKIEARLPKEPVARKKARTVPLWMRWTAAAVFAGAIVGTSVVLWPNGEESTTAPVASAKKTPDTTQEAPRQEEPKLEEPKPLPPSIEKASAPALIAIKTPIKSEKTVTPEPIETIKEETTASATLAEETPMKSEKKEETTPSAPQPEKTPEDVIRELDQKIAAYKQHRRKSAAINLYAANGFSTLSYRSGVLMSPEMLSNYDYYTNPYSHGTRGDGPVYLANHEERQKFYQPISFGLTVSVPISSAFSVSTGAVYTRLRSDFTSISNSLVYERQQSLHYVGIPLTVLYNVWQWRGLNVYAAAGGQADFNVKALLKANGVETESEKDDMQWSLNAAVGLQYNIIPQLGVYAEPGVKHYFDNGSHIRNFFKQHPTNFNLQVGLRITFK